MPPVPSESSFVGMPSYALALIAALLPACFAWWTGRRLARAADDPVLPELLLAREQRLTQLGLVVVVVLAILAGRTLLVALPVMIVTTVLASVPMRRALFDEPVRPATWVEHALRALLAGAGPWLLLVATPSIVLALPDGVRREGAIGLGLLLVAWLWGFVPVWLALNHAAPLDRRDVEPLLRDVAVRSRAPMPRLVRFGTPGIHLVNAYALPGVRVSTVAFSRRLLDGFEPAEIAAVFAHEMAHLEHFTPRRVRTARASALVLAAIAVFIPLAAPAWLAVLFPLLVLVALALRARRSQGHETESDRRAVELLDGDGETLARALTRLHVAARLPRRFDRDFERSATHPSLARRVQAIHAAAAQWRATRDMATPMPSLATPLPEVAASAAGLAYAATNGAHEALVEEIATNAESGHVEPAFVAPPFVEPASLARRLAAAMPLPVLLQSPRERTVVALAADRVYWFDDVPEDARLDVDALRDSAGSYRALRYGDVVELRVAASGGERWLLVRERTGEARRARLHPGDVGLAQRALDLVDGQLGHAETDHSPVVARIAAAALALLVPVLDGSGLATLLGAALVLWWPARPTLAALGAAAIAEALVAWLTGSGDVTNPLLPLAHATMGAIALGLAVCAPAAKAMQARPARATGTAVVLGAAALLAAAVVALLVLEVPGGERLDVLVSARTTIPAVALAAALAGALLVRRTLAGAVSLPAAVTGAVLLAAAVAVGGTTVAAARAIGATVSWADVTATAMARQPAGEGAFRVVASPSGTRWAVQRHVARGTPVLGGVTDGWDWDLGSFEEGRTRTVRALQLEFLDDARVVVVARRGDSLEVRLEPAFAGEDPLPRRPTPIPALLDPVLRVDRATGSWYVAGRPRPVVTGRPTIDGATEGTFEFEDDGAELEGMQEAFARPDTLVAASGRVGRDSTLVRRWVLPSVGNAVLPLADGGVLYTEMPRFDGSLALRAMAGVMPRGTLWRLAPSGARTRLGSAGALQCGSTSERGEALCVEHDLTRLRALLVDAHGEPVLRATVPARAAAVTRPTGARVAIPSFAGGDVVLLDASLHDAMRVVPGERAYLTYAVPTVTGFLGLHAGAKGMELVSWRLPR